jgi:hypothetical protein
MIKMTKDVATERVTEAEVGRAQFGSIWVLWVNPQPRYVIAIGLNPTQVLFCLSSPL